MNTNCILTIVLLILMAFANKTFVSAATDDENLISNGSFDEGVSKWGGQQKFIEEDGNKVGYINVLSFKQTMEQSFDTKGVKSVNVTLRYKASDDYKGKGFQVQIHKENVGWTYWQFRDVKIDKKAKWHDFKMNFSGFKATGIYSLRIVIPPGSGKLFFDDIKVTPTS